MKKLFVCIICFVVCANALVASAHYCMHQSAPNEHHSTVMVESEMPCCHHESDDQVEFFASSCACPHATSNPFFNFEPLNFSSVANSHVILDSTSGSECVSHSPPLFRPPIQQS